jgi:NAD(P)-dependent dehydrogenase (short-subunit alcohol dehydrogenase family)
MLCTKTVRFVWPLYILIHQSAFALFIILKIMFLLENATALVTGAGSGIGRATALQLARFGCTTLFLTGRRRTNLLETDALITNETQCRVICLDGDLSDADFRGNLVRQVRSYGPLDVLVNNAGVYSTDSFTQTSDESYRSLMSLNLDAVFFLTRDLLPALEAAKSPSVVNIGSTLSLRPIPQGAAYNIAKAGLDHLTRSLANELGPKRIRVNCVSPGITQTPMYRNRYDSDEAYNNAIETASAWHPLKGVGRAEDIANAVVFFAGPGAAWITGTVLPVDGGLLVT